MKFAVVILCAFAAVQGRNLESNDTPASPWLVHLRVARNNGRGLLDSCVGSLYNERWVLSSASCLLNARFVWVRYDAPNVFRPGFVTETSVVTLHPEYNAETGANDIALLNLNRDITFTDSIKPIEVADSEAAVPSAGSVCGYGEKDGKAGEDLFCVDVTVAESDGLLVAQSEGKATKYDFGAALVSDGKVQGVLVRVADENSSGAFLSTSKYVDWIKEVTSPEAPKYDDLLIVDSEDTVDEMIVVDGDEILVGAPTF